MDVKNHHHLHFRNQFHMQRLTSGRMILFATASHEGSLVACPSFALEFGIRPLLLPPMVCYCIPVMSIACMRLPGWLLEKLKNELEKQLEESQEAWKSTIESYKEQAAKMKDLSEEAYELYPKKAMVLFEDVSEQAKVQAKKARKYISLIAEQVTIEEGSIFLLQRRTLQSQCARLFIGGFLSFMLIVSIPAIRFGMILGGYSKKAMVLFEDVSEQVKVQATKAKKYISLVAEQVTMEGREYLSSAAENPPKPVKESGNFYCAVLFIGGFLSFMLIVSIPAIRFDMILGGALL
ncbi:uncharacterized protein LOC116267691 [Nymphaea colorata]|nr:uncharacterized protein LOC116267691 [Nymphaea colorata]